jgi:hypothetical protein
VTAAGTFLGDEDGKGEQQRTRTGSTKRNTKEHPEIRKEKEKMIPPFLLFISFYLLYTGTD